MSVKEQEIIPLSMASEGDHVTVVSLRGGSGFQARVLGMGLHVGCRAEVMIARAGGQTLIAVGATRIALGHGMAEKVLVRR